MTKYGSDKPDIRFGMEIVDITDISRQLEFPIFQNILAKDDGFIGAICVKNAADISRKQLDELTDFAKKHGSSGSAGSELSTKVPLV